MEERRRLERGEVLRLDERLVGVHVAQIAKHAIEIADVDAGLLQLAAQRLRVVADETVRQNKQHLDLAQGRYDVGFAPRFDVTQASVQLASAELAQVTAQKNVTLGRETLRNAMGMSGPLDFDVVDVLGQPSVKLGDEEAVEIAYENRPELVSIAAQQKAQALQIDALKKDYLPKVTGGANYTWSGSQYPLQDTWNIGAAVNLSVFNGGLTTPQVPVARANLAVLETSVGLHGHTHVPVAYREDDGRIDAISPGEGSSITLDDRPVLLNPGSVGQPRDGIPTASYALIDTDERRCTWQRATYDVEAVQRKMERAGLPGRLVARLSYGL